MMNAKSPAPVGSGFKFRPCVATYLTMTLHT